MSYDTKIACPKCDWEPDGGEYWQCSSCYHSWDTFMTGAVCPACKRQYKETQCIGYRGGCNQMSPHIDWYRELPQRLKEEVEEVNKEIGVQVD